MSPALSLAAALCMGVFCYCAAGFVTGHPPRLGRWRRGSARMSAEQLWLAQAGLAVTPAQFWAASAVAGIAALVGCTFLTGTVLVAVVPAVAAASLPRAFYGRRRAERLRAVQAAWPDALRDLLASIAAGRSLNGALIELASSGPEPLRLAFARFGAHARMLGTVPA
jgi:tight adherence protein B